MRYELPLGIDISDISAVKNAYELNGERKGCLTAVLGADRLEGFLRGFTQAMSEPIFFFIELPCSADEEKSLGGGNHYKIYYLDNCTKPVISAIIDRFGQLLINDGLCRFGFGGNEKEDEVYVQSYNVVSVYCSDDELMKTTRALLGRQGAEETRGIVTPWDVISPENPGKCMLTEEDGVSVYDIPELLKDAGMYFADTI